MVVRYDIETNKIKAEKRLVFLSDLHGQRPEGIEKEIAGLAPDIVVIGGDLFDSKFKSEDSFDLTKELLHSYACVFAPGNHDSVPKNEKKYRELAEHGLIVLDKGETEVISDISFSGVSSPGHFTHASAMRFKKRFSVLLDHDPDNAEKYPDGVFDLILSGHEHGGMMKIGRINGILGHSGLFPSHAGGIYRYTNTVQIVSRGLCEHISIRIGIPPELVLIRAIPHNSQPSP